MGLQHPEFHDHEELDLFQSHRNQKATLHCVISFHGAMSCNDSAEGCRYVVKIYTLPTRHGPNLRIHDTLVPKMTANMTFMLFLCCHLRIFLTKSFLVICVRLLLHQLFSSIQHALALKYDYMGWSCVDLRCECNIHDPLCQQGLQPC